ncbi:hypothetical protein ACS0TY_024267 [Phlomoides rotata]
MLALIEYLIYYVEDLQLDVKCCHDVYTSFDKYVEVEHLDGDNKYHAEQYGFQDAKKGVLFINFPPVLQLHLKRFEYDFARDVMVKTPSSPITTGSSLGRKTSIRIMLVSHGFPQNDVEI